MTPTILPALVYSWNNPVEYPALLDDASLVQWLLKQTKTKASLDHNEIHILSDYIHSRLTLIRDLAQERQSSWQHN